MPRENLGTLFDGSISIINCRALALSGSHPKACCIVTVGFDKKFIKCREKIDPHADGGRGGILEFLLPHADRGEMRLTDLGVLCRRFLVLGENPQDILEFWNVLTRRRDACQNVDLLIKPN